MVKQINDKESPDKKYAYSQMLRYGIWQAEGAKEAMGYTIRSKDWRYVEWFYLESSEVIAKELDDVVTVSEDAMSAALIGLLERAKMLVEPSGAAGVAALLDDPDRFAGPVVPVLSGGNIDALLLLDVIRHGLAAAGRFMQLRVRFADRPGELMRLLTDLAALQVNVLDVAHDRAADSLGVREVEVAVQVATRGPDHAADALQRLAGLGHRLV